MLWPRRDEDAFPCRAYYNNHAVSAPFNLVRWRYFAPESRPRLSERRNPEAEGNNLLKARAGHAGRSQARCGPARLSAPHPTLQGEGVKGQNKSEAYQRRVPVVKILTHKMSPNFCFGPERPQITASSVVPAVSRHTVPRQGDRRGFNTPATLRAESCEAGVGGLRVQGRRG